VGVVCGFPFRWPYSAPPGGAESAENHG